MAEIKAEIKGDSLIITAPLKDWKKSKSGKSEVIGTGGFVDVPGDSGMKYGLNILKG